VVRLHLKATEEREYTGEIRYIVSPVKFVKMITKKTSRNV